MGKSWPHLGHFISVAIDWLFYASLVKTGALLAVFSGTIRPSYVLICK
jgi:hypothetical protein